MSQRRVGVVGAGPAGIMAALAAAWAGAQVLLFDTNEIVGRKILVTGNGRCNISNADVRPERYTCAESSFLERMFAEIPPATLLDTLRDLGAPTAATADGWYYPLSKSAATVADALATAVELAGVELHLTTRVRDVRPAGDGFVLVAGDGAQTYGVERVIVASGGKAYPTLGSRGDLFPVLGALGHAIEPLRPALAPIVADMRRLQKLQGVRANVILTLLDGEQELYITQGNMMFTKTGLSGPAAMDLSHAVSARPTRGLTLSVDLLGPHKPVLLEQLARMRPHPAPLAVVLGSVLAPKIAPVLIPMAGLPADVRTNRLLESDAERVVDQLTHLRVSVKSVGDFDVAQVSAGGVPVTEVEPVGMASRVVSGLHLAGEVLDVIGPCGGFNLHFALTSGMLAGAGAASQAVG